MYDGYVFYCDESTVQKCLSNKSYSCSDKPSKPSEPIKEGSVIFLYNSENKTLLGPFTASTEGGTELESGTWAMSVDENIPSEDIKVTWEQLHLMPNAPEKLPLIESLKTCRLTSLETQNILDLLKQEELYMEKNAES